MIASFDLTRVPRNGQTSPLGEALAGYFLPLGLQAPLLPLGRDALEQLLELRVN